MRCSIATLLRAGFAVALALGVAIVASAWWLDRPRTIVPILAGVLLLLLALAHVLAMRALRPLRTLRAQMQRLVREHADEPVEAPAPGNEVAALEASFRLMSDRLNARSEALRRSRERLDYLLHAAPVMIYSAQPAGDHRTTFMSANVREQLGYAPEDFLDDATFWESRIHPHDRPAVLAESAALKPGTIRILEYRFRHRDGSWRWMRDHVVLVEGEAGARREQVGAWLDDSARHRAEVAMTEAMRAKVDFMNSVTHELRTPLNSVIGFAELLAEGVPGPLSERQAEYLKDILASGRQLLRIVEGILEMSRMDTAGVALAAERVDIDQMLRERKAAHDAAARARGVTLRFDDAPGSGGMAELDPKGLRRIIDALLDNAIKFNREGGAVMVGARLAGGVLEIAVEDTGPGIAKENLPRLFKPFVQLDAGLERRQGGVGLGLAVASRLAGLHGGTIEVESEFGKGSRFTLRLPQGEPT